MAIMLLELLIKTFSLSVYLNIFNEFQSSLLVYNSLKNADFFFN